jgi:hypothetical protein
MKCLPRIRLTTYPENEYEWRWLAFNVETEKCGVMEPNLFVPDATSGISPVHTQKSLPELV